MVMTRWSMVLMKLSLGLRWPEREWEKEEEKLPPTPPPTPPTPAPAPEGWPPAEASMEDCQLKEKKIF